MSEYCQCVLCKDLEPVLPPQYGSTEPARQQEGVERLAQPKPGNLYYLAGPMSFRADTDYNFPAFHDAAADLRSRGLRIINPAETAGGDPDMEKPRYMRIDFGYLLASDGIILLGGWCNSDGAKRELAVADALGLPAWEWDERGYGRFVKIKLVGLEVTYSRGK